jgi:putative Mg2+ transporter-C (MgtC) family protein
MILDGMLAPALLIAAAVLAGGLVGLNRDLHGKPTGVRAHALVALGAAVFVMSSTDFGIVGSDGNVISRVIQGVVGGIGFLGAGVILRGDDGRRTFHVATAASIWVTAALGVACGLGAQSYCRSSRSR